MPKFNYTKITPTDLILEVDINNLSNDEHELMFGKTNSRDNKSEKTAFIQEEDFVFEINVMMYLELNPTYNLLKKGKYPLSIKNEKIQVLLSLSPKE